MGISKWKFGGGKHLTPNGETGLASPSTLTVKPAPTSASDRSSSNINNNNNNNNHHLHHHHHNHQGAGPRTKSAPSPISWIRSSLRSSKRKSIISRDDPAFARLHKPFTPQNLEHQKLLSAFEWHFHDGNDQQKRQQQQQQSQQQQSQQQQGARRLSFVSSLSPCASRRPSVDAPVACVRVEPPEPTEATAEKGARFWDLRTANALLDRYAM